jgi:hypothetical protein
VGLLQLAAFPRANLGALVQQLTGMTTIWDGDPEPFVTAQDQCNAFGEPPIGFITLDMTSSITQGVDDEEDAFNPTTGANTHTQTGWRVVTIQARLASYNEVPAFDVAELLRTRMRRQDTCIQLSAMGLAFQGTGACVDFDKSADGRPIFYSTVDLMFTRIVQEVIDSPAPNDGGWIGSVTTGAGPTGATGPGWTGPLS